MDRTFSYEGRILYVCYIYNIGIAHTFNDFILCSTYSAIFYQIVTFNYGNKDESPLDNVKFYEKDKSAKLEENEVSI